MVDNEIKTFLDQYKDLQAEFQVNHQALEAAQKDSMVSGSCTVLARTRRS